MKPNRVTDWYLRSKNMALPVMAAVISLLSIAAPASQAGVIAPGATIPLSGTTTAASPDFAGTVIRDQLIPFAVADNLGTVILEGIYQDRVVRNNAGAIILSSRLRNLSTPAGEAWISGMRVGGYADFPVETEYLADGSGQVGPGIAVRSPAPGDTIFYSHDPQLIAPPDEGRFVARLTDATDYSLAGRVTIFAQNDFGAQQFAAVIDNIAAPRPYYIVGPGGSIQAAIDASSAGDTVFVEPGTYNENIVLRSGVSVEGAGAGETVLRGIGGTAAVTVDAVEDCVFSGFTVTGAGVERGIAIYGGSPLITGNTVTGNKDGILVASGSNAIICNNRILDNGTTGGALDYGILILQSTPLISNNLILRNETGVYIAGPDSGGTRVVNNTLADNPSRGIWCYQSSPELKSNIVTRCGWGIEASSNNATPVCTYNDVYGNIDDYNSQSTGTATPGVGSLAVDAQFDPAFPDDYFLLVGSPCIDAGDPAAIFNDLDGTRNDIGAYGGPCSAGSPTGSSFTSGFLFTSVGKIPTSEITKAGDDTGLANVSPEVAQSLSITRYQDAPFGGRLWLYGAFGNAESAVAYYTVNVGAWAGGSPPAPGALVPVDDPLSKVFYSVSSGGTITATNRSVGPLVSGGVPYYVRTDNNNSGGYWAHENVMLILNSLRLANGRYDIQLKGYTAGLVEVPFSFNPTLTLEINNTRPTAEIVSVEHAGNQLLECSVVNLANNMENLRFHITAAHADGYLDTYALSALVGRNRNAGTVASDQYVGSHDTPGPLWGGVVNTAFDSSTAMGTGALDPWETCAYQFRLTVWARTTDGYQRLYRTDFFDNYALNLGSPGGSGPDLDGDGDVDGDDLAIFAEAFGRPVAP